MLGLIRLSYFISLVGLVFGAPLSPQQCTDRTINLKSDWSLPTTLLDNFQNCDYLFNLPPAPGYFATVSVFATGTENTYVKIFDSLGDKFGSREMGTYNETLTLPTNFTISVVTHGKSSLQITVNITLHQENPQANIVKSYTTFAGSASTYIYTDSWTKGQSYKFTSKGSRVYLQIADTLSYSAEDEKLQEASWSGIFVYDNGNLVGTLNSVLQPGKFISTSNTVVLYMAKQVNLYGVVMVTDYSNVAGLFYHDLRLAPKGKGAFFAEGVTTKSGQESALTVVGLSDGTGNINVNKLTDYNNYGINASWSFIPGGPIQNHSNTKPLSIANLPTSMTGVSNTFYVKDDKDNAYIGFQVVH